MSQPCPSRAPHPPHGWPTEHGNAFYCPGVTAPVEDTSWINLDEARPPRDPFHELPPFEIWLMFLAQIAGAAVAFLCAAILPPRWGLLVFLIVNLALAVGMARILTRERTDSDPR